MPRSRLLRCLDELKPPTPAACLVLLYTFFEEVGAVDAENTLRERGVHPHRLRAVSPDPRRAVRRLERLQDSLDFDVFALRWLKGLDAKLGRKRLSELDSESVFQGVDGRGYHLGWRNAALFTAHEVDEAEDAQVAREMVLTWEADESDSLATYVWHRKPVPVDPLHGGRCIRCISEHDWGDPFLHRRLKRIWDQRELRVLLWPFCGRIDYQTEEESAAAEGSDPEIGWIRICGIRNHADLAKQMETAVSMARELQATILVLPELVLTGDGEDQLRRSLRRNRRDSFPLLTLAGRCHRRGTGRSDVNEAILLGPDGTELHLHRKLAAFTFRRQLGERLEVGKELAVLESRIGNLVPLICLDLPRSKVCELVERSHGNLVLVPSLSDTTQAHRHAAERLQNRNLAGTFVCNRRFHDPQPSAKHPAGTSFFRVPRPHPPREVLHFPDHADQPYLLFEL